MHIPGRRLHIACLRRLFAVERLTMRLAAWTFGGAMIGALAGHTIDVAAGSGALFVVLMAMLCGVCAFAMG